MKIEFTTDQIKEFLNTWAIKAALNEDEAITELMMDDHTYIEYNSQGYYISENRNSEEEMIANYLNNNYRT
ncbi:MAG: hypothetical protein LH629_06005 [Ignavibacteria bacterium]|nr:hypothetical protein [Ignavibacteria bacterium]